LSKIEINDTLYLIEGYNYNLETGELKISTTIINKNKILFYLNELENIKQIDQDPISNYITYLVKEWNIEQIKEDEGKYTPTNSYPILASKLIKKGKKEWATELVCFKYFFNLKKENSIDFIYKTN